MSTMTLEPCPFCGAKDAEVYPRDRSNLAWNVCCGNPGCVTRGDNDYLTESDAVAAWNRRAHPSQPAQAVDVGPVKQCYGEVIRAHAAEIEAMARDAEFLKVAETTLHQIATTPRNAGARRNANATMRFIETQRAAAMHDSAREGGE